LTIFRAAVQSTRYYVRILVCTYRWNYERNTISPTSEILTEWDGGKEKRLEMDSMFPGRRCRRVAPWALLVGVYKKSPGKRGGMRCRRDGMTRAGSANMVERRGKSPGKLRHEQEAIEQGNITLMMPRDQRTKLLRGEN